MSNKRSNFALLVGLIGAGALVLKRNEIMSKLTDSLNALAAAVTTFTTADAAVRQENADLRSNIGDLQARLADAQGNAATPEEIAQIDALTGQLNGDGAVAGTTA